jgi:hypothetical protein
MSAPFQPAFSAQGCTILSPYMPGVEEELGILLSPSGVYYSLHSGRGGGGFRSAPSHLVKKVGVYKGI